MLNNNHTNSDVAICLDPSGLVLTAAAIDNAGEIALAYFPVDGGLPDAVAAFRGQLNLPTGSDTAYRFVPFLYTEETKVPALDTETLLLGDDELIKFLIYAMKNPMHGADGKPLFPQTEQMQTVYDLVRLSSGEIALTELPRDVLELSSREYAKAAITNFHDADFVKSRAKSGEFVVLPDYLQIVETQMRVIARFLAVERADQFTELEPGETLAFFSFSSTGYAYSLYNSESGFFAELGEVFDVKEGGEMPVEVNSAKQNSLRYFEGIYNFINEQFYHRVVPKDEESAPLNVKNILWAADDGLTEPVSAVFREFSEISKLPVEQIKVPRTEMIVKGLLYNVAELPGAELIPPINLAADLTFQHEEILRREAAVEEDRVKDRRAAAIVFLLIPAACVLGLVFGLYFNNMLHAAELSSRREIAAAEIARLQPLIDQRREYEKTLAWYEDVLRQIVALRQKQVTPLLFAWRLDRLYPAYQSFFIDELSLKTGGVFEIKGLAKDEQAVVDFVHALEFSANSGGKRDFTDLTLGFKQGSSKTSESGSAGSSQVSGALAGGVSGFLIKGVFPDAAIIKEQTNAATSAAPTPVPPPAAAPLANPGDAIGIK